MGNVTDVHFNGSSGEEKVSTTVLLVTNFGQRLFFLVEEV